MLSDSEKYYLNNNILICQIELFENHSSQPKLIITNKTISFIKGHLVFINGYNNKNTIVEFVLNFLESKIYEIDDILVKDCLNIDVYIIESGKAEKRILLGRRVYLNQVGDKDKCKQWYLCILVLNTHLSPVLLIINTVELFLLFMD